MFFFVVLILYTLFKYETLLMYNDTTVLISSQENYYTEKDVIKGGKDSFNVAFGLISYDSADQDTDH